MATQETVEDLLFRMHLNADEMDQEFVQISRTLQAAADSRTALCLLLRWAAVRGATTPSVRTSLTITS